MTTIAFGEQTYLIDCKNGVIIAVNQNLKTQSKCASKLNKSRLDIILIHHILN